MDIGLFIPVFIAGVLTFLAPCTLPLVPGYLGLIGGAVQTDKDKNQPVRTSRSRVFFNGLFFVFGFSMVFILLGVLFGFIGSQVAAYRYWLSKIGGVFVILFGLFMTGIIKIQWLENVKGIPLSRLMKSNKSLTSFLVGASFGLGWTPCIGPILGSVLFIASSSETALEGGLLLFIFSLGLAIPFLIIALGVGHATQYIKRLSRIVRWTQVIGGLFLVFLGVLLFTNSLGIWVSWFFKIFHVINYDNLLNYL